MPRKPITAELIGGKGTRQRLWEAIRKFNGAPWSRDALVIATRINESTAESYLQGLLAAGHIAVENQGERTKARRLYTLVRDVGAEAPRVDRKGRPVTQGLAQEQMWRVLRLQKGDCNATELAAHASTREIQVLPASAHAYLCSLNTAGYLDITREFDTRPNHPGGSQRRYRLKADRNTGPRPPMICRTQAVFDPNESRIVWQPEITEEDVIYGR